MLRLIFTVFLTFCLLAGFVRTIDVDKLIKQHDAELLQLKTIVAGLQEKLSDSDLEARVAVLEENVGDLGESVSDLEARGGAGTDVTDLSQRVETLEEVTSLMSGDISDLQMTSDDLKTRIQALESATIEPLEACLSSPCENDATCVEVNVETFICLCRDGYFGVTCEDSYQDAVFLAALTSNISGVPNPLIFDREEINPGSHYDGSTGVYTVPYDGIYQFSVNVQYSGYVAINIIVDNSATAQHEDIYYRESVYYRSVTVIEQLTTGQTVHVRLGDNSRGAQGCDPSLCSYFTGHLISA